MIVLHDPFSPLPGVRGAADAVVTRCQGGLKPPGVGHPPCHHAHCSGRLALRVIPVEFLNGCVRWRGLTPQARASAPMLGVGPRVFTPLTHGAVNCLSLSVTSLPGLMRYTLS